ncbi:DUF5989 family protein [Thioalkalivibrio sp. XN8]|uniref:DUF5989 family protein n=1 Tax=Thioalkalivibrio sp. XN8 TaxID=2712863 RepID=UPI0013EDFBA9|nr:DUF5989 family protein [Thioalkalivibrio sp. XN8]NGP54532.1 hypothetical protein [Thioalkalivibrio sp. XN8]
MVAPGQALRLVGVGISGFEDAPADQADLLAPIIVVLLLLGGLVALAQGSAVAPDIYTLF